MIGPFGTIAIFFAYSSFITSVFWSL